MNQIITNDKIYRKPDAPYPQYRININHPDILPLYTGFRRRNNLPTHFPISDKERKRFEDAIFAAIKNGKIVVKGQKNQPAEFDHGQAD
ncbi:MAG: hypothetical protein QM689_12625 [Oscillospiraceae bacterium]